MTEVYHRRNPQSDADEVLAFFALGPPLLVSLNSDAVHVVPFYASSDSRYIAKTSHDAAQPTQGDVPKDKTAGRVHVRPCLAEMGGAAGATGCISRCGRVAYVGSVKGELSLVKLDTMKVICHTTCSEQKLRVMHVHASANEDKILINGYDRTMRVYDVDMAAAMRLADEDAPAAAAAAPAPGSNGVVVEHGNVPPPPPPTTRTGAEVLLGANAAPAVLRLVHVYKNSVENFAWGNCCISHDCRYVVGSPSAKVRKGNQPNSVTPKSDHVVHMKHECRRSVATDAYSIHFVVMYCCIVTLVLVHH